MIAEEKNTDWYMIEKKATAASPLDFDALRARGIDLTQRYSGESWTDYNLHDPGVTILEALCYALTDLAYRTNFPLEDILTGKDGKINKQKNFFFTAREILSTNPVSVIDFRKLVIDRVPELDNVWLEPVLSRNRMQYCKGLYKVYIRLGDALPDTFDAINELAKKTTENDIIKKVRECINEARNLGEDFEDLVLLKATEVRINANILVTANEFTAEVLSEIYAVLDKT